MIKFTFCNKDINVVEKKDYVDILCAYTNSIKQKERKLNFVRRISSVFRELGDCDLYGHKFVAEIKY